MSDDSYVPWRDGLASLYPDRLPPVHLREHAVLTPPDDGLELVTASVTATGEAIALWSTPDDTSIMFGRHGHGMFPDSHTRRPVRSVVTVGDDVIIVPEHEIAVPALQTLSDGRILLVGARASWNEAGGEHNAVLMDPNGERIKSGCLGDGINHVYTDLDDNIWVGYFDEGTGGNFGWGGIYSDDGFVETDEPIGASGLVRFDDQLTKAWEWPARQLKEREDFDADPWICDCYALNVADRSVWMSYYTAFPLVRIDGNHVAVAAAFEHAVNVVLADGELAAGIGHYRMPDLVRPICLSDGVELPPRILALPDGTPPSTGLSRGPQTGSTFGAATTPAPRIQRHARGSELHVFAGVRWLRANLEDLAATA